MRVDGADLGETRSGLFLPQHLDDPNHVESADEIRALAQRIGGASSPVACAERSVPTKNQPRQCRWSWAGRIVPLPADGMTESGHWHAFSSGCATANGRTSPRRERLLDLNQSTSGPVCRFSVGAATRDPGVCVMFKKIAVAATAVLITSSPLAYAAETSSTVGMRHPSAADLNALTDARVGIIKAALQLTPDQEKYWAAVEEAIRARAKNRQARLERVAELRDSGPMEVVHERNPVELMQRRAEILNQRAADLKKLADAWEPLYKTLTTDQKKRMAFATYAAMRGVRDTIERRLESEDDDD